MARLNKTRREDVKKVLPPTKCGRNTRAGTPCERWVVIGTTVCYMHGGASPQALVKAEERVSLAEALARGDKRHPWDVMEDTLHVADVLMQQVLLEVRDKGAVSPALLDKVVSAIERANRLSKTVLDAGVAERRTRLAEGQAEQMHRFVTQVLRALNLTPEQKALVPGAVKGVIEGMVVPDRRGIAA